MTNLLTRLAALPELCAAAEAEARKLLFDFRPELNRDDRADDINVAQMSAIFGALARATLSRLLDPNNPAAEGVLADLYRRATGWESAHADPVTDDDRTFAWQIVHLAPAVGMAQMPAWVDIDGTQAPTRYEAWGFALAAHYDLAAQTKTS